MTRSTEKKYWNHAFDQIIQQYISWEKKKKYSIALLIFDRKSLNEMK
jgi:hypothetical protein